MSTATHVAGAGGVPEAGKLQCRPRTGSVLWYSFRRFLILGGCCILTGAVSHTQVRKPVILYTNDFHSAVDPIPAYWMAGTPKLGAAAHLSTLVGQIREREPATFSFDTGDMFTGMLSFLTKGEALMEMMAATRYDALRIENHEFEYRRKRMPICSGTSTRTSNWPAGSRASTSSWGGMPTGALKGLTCTRRRARWEHFQRVGEPQLPEKGRLEAAPSRAAAGAVPRGEIIV